MRSTVADLEREKHLAAERAVDEVAEGMAIGLGSGSTATHFVRMLGERVRAGLRVRGVPSSDATRALAAEVGIPLVTFKEAPRLDLAVDGADQIDGQLQLIKGGGGALLREKIVASAAARFVVIADSSKVADALGSFPLPVEVFPFGLDVVAARLAELGARTHLRLRPDGQVFLTDQGNPILDCDFGTIGDPRGLAATLAAMPGIAEHGLFVDMADAVIVARGEAVEVLTRRK